MSEYGKSKESFFPSCLLQMLDFRVLRAETPASSFLSLLVNFLSLDPVSPLLAFPACHMLHQGCLVVVRLTRPGWSHRFANMQRSVCLFSQSDHLQVTCSPRTQSGSVHRAFPNHANLHLPSQTLVSEGYDVLAPAD